MTRLSNYALTQQPATDVIAAYAAAPYEPVAKAVDAPWVVYGAFRVPQAISARLEVVGMNTGPAVLMVRVFEDGAATDAVVVVLADVDSTFYSPPFNFSVGKLYQIAVIYEGTSGVACVRAASLGAA